MILCSPKNAGSDESSQNNNEKNEQNCNRYLISIWSKAGKFNSMCVRDSTAPRRMLYSNHITLQMCVPAYRKISWMKTITHKSPLMQNRLYLDSLDFWLQKSGGFFLSLALFYYKLKPIDDIHCPYKFDVRQSNEPNIECKHLLSSFLAPIQLAQNTFLRFFFIVVILP